MQPSTEQQQQIQTRKLVWSVSSILYIFLTNFILTRSFHSNIFFTNTHKLKLYNLLYL